METVLLGIKNPCALGAGNSAATDSATKSTSSDNLAAAFVQIAAGCNARAAVETKSASYSYEWLLSAALHVQRHLRSRADYYEGAFVALQLSNSVEYLAAFYGTLLADCVVVPLPPAMKPTRRQELFDRCAPIVLLTKAEDAPSLNESSAVIDLNLSDSARQAILIPALNRGRTDLAMLLFTSGSTGQPKGVMLSHRNLIANANSIMHALPMRVDDRHLVMLPFCHAYGNSILQTSVLSGATLLLRGAMVFPVSIINELRDSKATTLSGVPEVYSTLLKHGPLGKQPLETLRYMTVAGGKLRYKFCVDVANRIAPAEFFVMYGQTEATARLAVLPPDQLLLRHGSIGKPIQGVEFRIVGDENQELLPGEVGMLCARGENIMLGYWGDAAATAEVLPGDGWLRTNDLAHRDRDGYYYLHGRTNLLGKIQGYRVHPLEIETLVENAFPDVATAAILTEHGDSMRIVLFFTSRKDRPVDVEGIRAVCQRFLPSYEIPAHYEMLDHFPLTSSQKTDRGALQVLAAKLMSLMTRQKSG